MRLSWSLVALLVLTSGCREHELVDGTYQITPTEILRDDCGLSGEDLLGLANTETAGNHVVMTLSKVGLRLVGTYRFSTEEMTLDGTLSNYVTMVRGRECLLDTVNIHLDTSTSSPSAFTGAMSINYQAPQIDECGCKYWFKLDAQQR